MKTKPQPTSHAFGIDKANARLMAAAPDLLAAARHLLPRARMAKRLSKADMILLESVIAKATQP